MQATISKELLKKITPKPEPFEIRDKELRGFLVRVQPSGSMSYIVQYARGKRITLGSTSVLAPAKARDLARERLAEFVYTGEDPMEAKKLARSHTLESFVSDRYKEWLEANTRHGAETLRKIGAFYPILGSKKLAEITSWLIEKHRTARLKAGTSASTVNRELDSLRASLSKAVEWKLIKAHPMGDVKRSRVDRTPTVRYLLPDEDKRLRAALDAREAKRRHDRVNFNSWRRERGYKEFPPFGAFTDHLKPMVIIALNTGMRRGELFNLRWSDIDFGNRLVTVTGRTAKSLQTRHLPLNDEAFEAVQLWHAQRKSDDLVFPGPGGSRMSNIKTSWSHLMKKAKVKGFRFHDCRHDFASKLVMAGEDLNTVRELLGHSDIRMTLRYAHLAPHKLAAAVAKLGGTR
jgi:integrase